IRGENLNLLEHSYISNSNKIVSRARATGMNINWGMQNRNALNALLNGEHTTAGQMQGYTIPFGLIKDRQTGLFFYERAIRRLGDNQTIIDRLSKELAQSLVLGEGIGQISSRIKKVTDYSHMRAVRIARTETLRVVNQGHMLAARQALEQYDLPMVKVWISTNDDRVRETHEEQQGEEREMDELFSNGLMYPLDPNGAPEEIINCRCVMITRIKGLRGSQAYRDLVERTDPYNSMIGMRTSNGIRVSSISKHLTDRADERNVTAANIRNALTSPLEISTIKIDGKGRASQRFMGIRAMAAINPETGNLISTNATGTQRRRSYARKNS
ncbi:MAG: phage head morphogenesis protein, partial [Defluviitaleaceae bacterium]|nr:phage head morphogenesis protein [Defluviitaleaceae bacterium]